MVLTSHAIIGAAIANAFPNDPYIGLTLSFASHYIFDLLPHINYGHEHYLKDKEEDENYKINWKDIRALIQILYVILDVFFAIILVIFMFVRDKQTFVLSVAGAILGVLPDALNFLSYKFSYRFFSEAKKLHNLFHDINNKEEYRHSFTHGVTTQIVAVVFVVIASFLTVSINP